MRIAFVTPEFPTEYANGGGLGNYLNRMCCLLAQAGHSVEVFVPSEQSPCKLNSAGFVVHRVSMLDVRPTMLYRMRLRNLARRFGIQQPASDYRFRAQLLADSLQQRHAVEPFDLVQSADYFAVGMCIPAVSNRIHAIRCSCPSDLYNEMDGKTTAGDQLRVRMELQAIRNADIVYAPSRLVADHYTKRFGLDVRVIRPPIYGDVEASETVPAELPKRYLLHFGQQMKRKGTEWLAESLCIAFKKDPTIRVVFLGRSEPDFDVKIKRTLKLHLDKTIFLPPSSKPEVMAILKKADATLAPSLVDNLPNTTIESLECGIPVIGTRGASIDELVTDGINGYLVPMGDVQALADTIVEFWKGNGEVRKGFDFHALTKDEWSPGRAIERLLSLVNQPVSCL